MEDRTERLDAAELWLRDVFKLPNTAAGVLFELDIDMSATRDAIESARSEGPRLTYTHCFVRAAALAMGATPSLNDIAIGRRRLRSGRVDIGLSVAADSIEAPVMVIEDAARKPLPEIAREVIARTPEVRERSRRNLDRLRRWGWLVPFGPVRRAILKGAWRNPRLRRRSVGTLQLTTLKEVDVVAALIVNTPLILGIGRVAERVVAVDGAPVVRPTVNACVGIDHQASDGLTAARYLGEFRRIVETASFTADLERD